MRFRTLALLAAVGFVSAGSSFAFAAPVDDMAISSAADEYKMMFKNAVEAGERPGQADMGDFTDKVLEKITLGDLTLDQINQVIRSLPVIYSTKTRPALDAHLTTLAAASSGEGARAAITRLQLMDPRATPAQKLERITEVLQHAGLADAVAQGGGGPLLATASDVGAEGLKAIQPKLVALAGSIRSDAPSAFFSSAAGFQFAVARQLDTAGIKSYEPLRSAVSAAGAEKLKGNVAENEKTRLSDAIARINGAYARGELIGHTAPQIEFLSFTDPADPNHKVKTLADLKGKVVVIDFWATWCGPCIASFPKVKALNRYYRGFDVVVLGVTSPQGAVSLASGRVMTPELDKEIELTAQFLKEKEVSWPTAIAKQNVFNPDFGVTGIPSVAIIDAEGKVRHAGLHPASPLEEKTMLIDKLLGEAKLPLPAMLMMPKADPK